MDIGLNFHRPKNGRTAFQAKRMMCEQRLRDKRSKHVAFREVKAAQSGWSVEFQPRHACRERVG